MKKNILLTFAVLAITFNMLVSAQSFSNHFSTVNTLNSSGQNSPQTVHSRNCGTMEYLEKEMQNDPKLREKMLKNEEELQLQIQNLQLNSSNKATTIYKIPVVVHVVYKDQSQNVSDAQIYSQIAALNRDYRKLNSDVNQLPSAFSALAADVGIEFCLASVDPNGQPTNGITRTLTTEQNGFGNPTPSVKSDATGGKSPWNTAKYMNMWVCDLQESLLGYAQFPGTLSASTDGIVIDYKYFGTTGTSTAPFDLGRTATHEVGHYLNLRHIWGDANCGDDYVSDTPTQQASNAQCPNFPHVTCGNGPNGDLFYNYMDYVDDACMFMFTNGQKARMIATLTGTGSSSRASLLTNTNVNCSTPTQVLSCDTSANYTASTNLVVYRTTDVSQPGTGYIAGTNSFGDIGFAEKFTALQPLQKIYGVVIAFGRAYGFSTASFNVKVWKADGVGGVPGTVLATKSLTLNDIIGDINSQNYSSLSFTNPVSVSSGAYYIGIEFNNSTVDTIALYTTVNNSVTTGKAYEEYDNGSWYPFTDGTNSWGVNVALAIAPAICIDYTGITEQNEKSDAIQVYPNPSEGIFTAVSSEMQGEQVSLKVFNSVGALVLSEEKASASGNSLSFDLSQYPQGLYIVELSLKDRLFVKRINLIH